MPISIFIGMPVFNCADHIEKAIVSVINQKYKNWILLISDNNSIDETGKIALEFSKKDRRIKYVKQYKNVGPAGNFLYVLNKSDCEYFVWLAADDIWLPSFLSVCVSNILNYPHVGLSFTNLHAIDEGEKYVRGCPILPILSGKRCLRTVLKYVFTMEISGKANLIYGVLKTDLAKKAWIRTIGNCDYWGQDMCFILAIVCRSRIHIDESICFYKRYSHPIVNREYEITSNYNKNPYIPIKDFILYFKGMLKASRNTIYFFPVLIAMLIRLILNFISKVSK